MKKVLLTSIMHALAIYEWGHALKRIFLTSIMFLVILSFMPLTAVTPSLAEIYRWKDDAGIVRYSNAPPKDDGKEGVDVIPTRRVPFVEDANGTVYYLNLPDSGLTQNMSFQDVLGRLTLPDDVLDELMEEASVTTQDEGAGPRSMVAFRLAELEEALDREITTRVEWEQEYLKSQSRSKDLEQRNEHLQLALVDMEAKIDKVQKAVALSDLNASVLREPQQKLGQLENRLDELQATLIQKDPEQDLGRLQGKIVQLQAYLTDMSRQSEEDAAALSSTLDSVQEEQGVQLASLSDRLDELEIGVSSVQQQSLAEKFSALDEEMQILKASLPESYDDSQLQVRLRELQHAQEQQIGELEAKFRELESIEANYKNSMQALSEKLKRLEAGMEALDHSSLLAQIDSLSQRIIAFERQPEDDTIHVKLAALESAMVSLTDAAPTARSLSNFEALGEAQTEQLEWQRLQIAMLRDELERFKAGKRVPQKTEHSDSSSADSDISGDLHEKNAQMEDVIQQQAGIIMLQQEQIAAIESKLERVLEKVDSPVRLEEEPQKASSGSSGKITVVERQYRRGAQRPSALGVYVKK